MTLSWSEHPAAREEFFHAQAWCEDQEARLGDRLADDVANCVQSSRKRPDAAPPHLGRAREPRVRTKDVDVLSYRIIYVVRRRPGYSRKRLNDLRH